MKASQSNHADRVKAFERGLHAIYHHGDYDEAGLLEAKIALLNSVESDYSFIIDANFRVLYVNEHLTKRICEVLGEGLLPLVGKDYWQVFPFDSTAQGLQYFRRALETGEVQHFELFSFTRKMPLSVYAHPDHQGVLVWTYPSKVLSEVQAFSSSVHYWPDDTGEIILILDKQWRYLYANTHAAALVGQPVQSIAGQHYQSLFQEPYSDVFKQHCQQVIETRQALRFEALSRSAATWLSIAIYPHPAGVIIYARPLDSRLPVDAHVRLFEAAIAHSNDSIVICDAATLEPHSLHIVYSNDTFMTMSGYSTAQLIGKNPLSLHSEASDASLYQALQQWQPYRGEHNLHCRDGRRLWVELSLSPVVDASGQQRYWVMNYRDIQARKDGEEALRQSEAKFRSIVDNVNDFVVCFNKQGVFTYLSSRWFDTLGYAVDDWLGKEVWPLLHPEDLENARAGFAKFTTSGQRTPSEFRIKHSDGHWVWFRVKSNLSYDSQGQVNGMISVAQDITQKKLQAAEQERLHQQAIHYRNIAEQRVQELLKVKQALEQSEVKFRSIVDNVNDFVVCLNKQGVFTYLSSRWFDTLGYAVDDWLGKEVWPLLHPENLENTRANFAKFTTSGQRTPSEVRIRHSDGHWVWLCLRSNLSYDSQGQVNGVISVAQDITQKKLQAAEQERLHQQAIHYRNIAEQRVQELLKVKQALEQSNANKRRFVSQVSHELRNPLGALYGFSELLLEHTSSQTSSGQAEIIKDISQISQHMLELVRDLQDLAKVEAGTFSLHCEALEVSSLLQESLRPFALKAAQKNVAMWLEPGTSCRIWADKKRLYQVLYNLLSNALKFTPAGGEVRLRWQYQHDMLQIDVCDNGVGIAPEDQSKLFRDFGQLANASAIKEEGSGLGLALSKQLITLHQGTMWLKSSLGQGSTFSFTVPLAMKQNTPAEPALPIALPPEVSAAQCHALHHALQCADIAQAEEVLEQLDQQAQEKDNNNLASFVSQCRSHLQVFDYPSIIKALM